ncbi:MAG: rod shape-determining protein MreD [Bacteroidia bacterium]|nr:rod shape-determining protein MreD [Bacteroidia bacterium]
MNKTIPYIKVFAIVFLIQIFVLRNLDLGGWFIPYIYPYSLIILHPAINRNLGLIIGFIYGLLIDVFYNTSALHAFASTASMFFRPFYLKYFSPRDGFDEFSKINEGFLGTNNYWYYTLIMMFSHHFLLFGLEAFRWDYVLTGMLRSITSLLCGVLFLYIFKKLIFNRIEP